MPDKWITRKDGKRVKLCHCGSPAHQGNYHPIHSSNLVGRMVDGVPKGTRSYISAKTAELKVEKQIGKHHNKCNCPD